MRKLGIQLHNSFDTPLPDALTNVIDLEKQIPTNISSAGQQFLNIALSTQKSTRHKRRRNTTIAFSARIFRIPNQFLSLRRIPKDLCHCRNEKCGLDGGGMVGWGVWGKCFYLQLFMYLLSNQFPINFAANSVKFLALQFIFLSSENFCKKESGKGKGADWVGGWLSRSAGKTKSKWGKFLRGASRKTKRKEAKMEKRIARTNRIELELKLQEIALGPR